MVRQLASRAILFSCAAGLDLPMQWVETLPPKKTLDSHTVCNNATGYCRAMAHFVFTASPEDIALPLTGGAAYSLDGQQSWATGTPARFESHLINGICLNHTDSSSCVSMPPSQMWDWNYDAVFPISELDAAAMEVCAKPFLRSPYTDETGELEAMCLPLKPVQYIDVIREIGSFKPKFIYANLSEAADHYCGDTHCRTVVHAVLLASVPDPTDTVEMTTRYSIDNGPWITGFSSSFFENKMSLKADGSWYQTFQWDFDRVVAGKVEPPSRVCFQFDLANRVSMESVSFNFTEKFGNAEDGFLTRCLDFCETNHLSAFHNPLGYCDKSAAVSV